MAVGVIVLFGCGKSTDDGSPLTAATIDGTRYILPTEPDGAVGVIAARESASNGDSIVVVGRIGGAEDPWIEGRAAFILLDASMTLVANGTEGDSVEICLDDCCATERAASTTLVKVVDESGRVLAADARQLLGVAEDDVVVVRGKVNKDNKGNFAVLADGIHLRR
jgi:hypothetical protein